MWVLYVRSELLLFVDTPLIVDAGTGWGHKLFNRLLELLKEFNQNLGRASVLHIERSSCSKKMWDTDQIEELSIY